MPYPKVSSIQAGLALPVFNAYNLEHLIEETAPPAQRNYRSSGTMTGLPVA